MFVHFRVSCSSCTAETARLCCALKYFVLLLMYWWNVYRVSSKRWFAFVAFVAVLQCEEEALAALIKTRCILDNFEPALEMLAKNHASPQSIEPWTLTQVGW